MNERRSPCQNDEKERYFKRAAVFHNRTAADGASTFQGCVGPPPHACIYHGNDSGPRRLPVKTGLSMRDPVAVIAASGAAIDAAPATPSGQNL
jgi:hypothetical protein